jgi:hypothetical protein
MFKKTLNETPFKRQIFKSITIILNIIGIRERILATLVNTTNGFEQS